MSWCLTKDAENKLIEALKKDGDPQKMVDRGTEGRAKWFAQFGEENAHYLNSLFESKMLLKSQQKGFQSFAKSFGGSKQIKTDFLSKVERLNKALSKSEVTQFLKDYTETRLGVRVTEQEAKVISDLSNKIGELKKKASPEGIFPTKDDTLNYGFVKEQLESYVNELKLQSKNISWKEEPIKAVIDTIGKVPGTFKSLLSSFDDSFFGRQGIKTLLDIRTSHIWFKNFAKSFKDIGKELLDKDAMKAIKVDIYSRPNAVNGKYTAGKYGLDVLSEEAFPSSLPERIPLLGRLYKASQSAYNGGALRMRADLADRYIKIAEKQGLNMLDGAQAQPLGNLIGSLTGRGNLGKGEVLARETNLFLFSIKFLKANFDSLTAPARYLIGKTSGITGVGKFANKGAEFASKEAAKNMLAVTASIASILSVAKFLDPNSVEEDPRSTNFGKVKIFGRWTDITGGMAPMTTLAMRLAPTIHNGQWGFWSKSKTGEFTNLTSGKYGQDDALDTFENFFEGKLSPILGIVRDVWKGKTYSGDKPTPLTLTKGAITPITVQTFEQMMKDPGSSNILASMILEEFGFSTAPQTYPTKWDTTGTELNQFKEKIGEEEFKKANDKFNEQYDNWFRKKVTEDDYKNLSDKDKNDLITKKKEQIKQDIFDDKNFTPTKKKKEENPIIKKLLNFKLVKEAFASEEETDQSIISGTPENKERNYKIANKLRDENTEWYYTHISEKDEIAMTGKKLGLDGLKQKEPNGEIKNIVLKTARKYKLHPALLTAILWQESGYNPKARNDGGEKGIDRGIVQINTKAFPNITDKQADDPNFAIDWMGKQFASRLKYFDGDISRALAGHNVGQGGANIKGNQPFGGGERGQTYINNVSRNLTDEAIERLGLKTSTKVASK